MKNKVVVNFDYIGYRQHLFKVKKQWENARDEYCYKNLMWSIYNSIAFMIQKLISDMDDYVTFKE